MFQGRGFLDLTKEIFVGIISSNEVSLVEWKVCFLLLLLFFGTCLYVAIVGWKFMACVVGCFTLQSMANTNHKFPAMGVHGEQKAAIVRDLCCEPNICSYSAFIFRSLICKLELP